MSAIADLDGARRAVLAGFLTLAMPAACTPAVPTGDAGLPGVAATSSDRLRGEFVRLVLASIRTELESWSTALRGEGTRPFHAHYHEDAVIVQPGGALLKGEAAVREFSDGVRAQANDGLASLLDFDASDGIAYVYGAYHFQPAGAGGRGSAGRQVTVFRRVGGQWRIRSQLFQPGSSEAPFPGVGEGADPSAIDLGTTDAGKIPRDAFMASVTQLAALRRAWVSGDRTSLARAFHRDGLLQLPEAPLPARASAIPAALDAALGEFASLSTVELDFTASGRLAAVLGAFYLERREGEGYYGHYMAVLSQDGAGWKIRALVLS